MNMGIVGAGFSMSLDGFIAGPDDDVQLLFAWYFSGDADHEMSSGDTDYKITSDAAEMIDEASQATGAIISGRRMFDVARAWGGKHPMNVPVVVLTHSVPEEWTARESPFTFVTEGIEAAVAKAKQIAGDKNVAVGGANVMRQCIKAGLLDEIHIDLIPVLLGDGVRLFDYLGVEPIELETTQVAEAAGVIHLTFRIVK
jgi:dihydrofolate reductase